MDDKSLSNDQAGEEKQQGSHESGLPSPGLPKPNGLGITLPRPTVTTAPPPSPTGYTLPLPEKEPQKEVSAVADEEFDLRTLSEEESNDLYYKARNYFYLSFASMVPVIGLLVAAFCWFQTRGWKEKAEGWEINDTIQMVALAARMSQVWFVFSCINTFICLTGAPFPNSLIYLSFAPLFVGVLALPQALVLSVTVYHLLDIELERNRILLVAIRAVAGSVAYMEVSLLVFHSILFIEVVLLLFVCAALYAIINRHHVIPHAYKVIIVAFTSWLTLWGTFKLISIALKFFL